MLRTFFFFTCGPYRGGGRGHPMPTQTVRSIKSPSMEPSCGAGRLEIVQEFSSIAPLPPFWLGPSSSSFSIDFFPLQKVEPPIINYLPSCTAAAAKEKKYLLLPAGQKFSTPFRHLNNFLFKKKNKKKWNAVDWLQSNGVTRLFWIATRPLGDEHRCAIEWRFALRRGTLKSSPLFVDSNLFTSCLWHFDQSNYSYSVCCGRYDGLIYIFRVCWKIDQLIEVASSKRKRKWLATLQMND